MNAEGRWQGQLDPPLSARGEAQARALAARLRARAPAAGFARLVCSDLRRAQQTASYIGSALGLTPQPLLGLREIAAGCWSGLMPAEIARRWPQEFAHFQSGSFKHPAGDGETRHQAQTRVHQTLTTLDAEPPPTAPILVVTHGGVLGLLGGRGFLGNGEMCWVARPGDEWRVLDAPPPPPSPSRPSPSPPAPSSRPSPVTNPRVRTPSVQTLR